jgi:hypothetical protein
MWDWQSKTVDDDPLCWVGFTPDAILTSCKTGKDFSPKRGCGAGGYAKLKGVCRTYSDVDQTVGAGAAAGGEEGCVISLGMGAIEVGWSVVGLFAWAACWFTILVG